MRQALVFAMAALLPLCASQALAQDDDDVDTLCYYNGERFSPNTVISFGAQLVKCGSDGSWDDKVAANTSSNCFHTGRIYSMGARVSINNNQTITCKRDGTWE